jgi:hypothetical protein
MGIIFIFLGALFGIIIGKSYSDKIYKSKIITISRISDKNLEMFLLMNRWIQNEWKGKKIADYLAEKRIYRVIIYGMGYMGKNLYEQLINEKIEILYLIDRDKNVLIEGKEVKCINDRLDGKLNIVDAIIVTAIYDFEEIEEELKLKFNKPVISLSDIIYKM